MPTTDLTCGSQANSWNWFSPATLWHRVIRPAELLWHRVIRPGSYFVGFILGIVITAFLM